MTPNKQMQRTRSCRVLGRGRQSLLLPYSAPLARELIGQPVGAVVDR
jgi:hypothetical protein